MTDLEKIAQLIDNNFKLLGKDIKAALVTASKQKPPVVNVPEVKVPAAHVDVKMPPMPEHPPYPAFPPYPAWPEIKLPAINVPKPEVTVNVEKADAPIVNIPAPIVNIPAPVINYPDTMKLANLDELAKSITKNLPEPIDPFKEITRAKPLPTMIVDSEGRQISKFWSEMTAPSIVGLKFNDSTGTSRTVSSVYKLPVDATFGGTVVVELDKDDDSVSIWSNTAKDGTGTKLQPIVDADGHTQVDVLSSALPSGAATAANQQTDALTDTELRANAILVKGANTFGDLNVAHRNNQIEVSFFEDPDPANLVDITLTGSGSATQFGGEMLMETNATGASTVKAISRTSIAYKPGAEIYALFTAIWVNQSSTSSSPIGLYDDDNGFMVGFFGTTFGVYKRVDGVTSHTAQTSFNGDLLDGNASSKFTSGGTPVALNKATINVFRIRFGWLGSATIYYEIMAPDGHWVTFHVIRYPNTAITASILNPNLPMRAEVIKTSGSTDVRLATGSWAAGITSNIVETNGLTDTQLRASKVPVKDDYQAGEILADQNGAGAALTFTFGTAVDMIWVVDVGAVTTNISRVDPFGGTPTASLGIPLFNQTPNPIFVTPARTTIKVFAPAGATITMYGHRRT